MLGGRSGRAAYSDYLHLHSDYLPRFAAFCVLAAIAACRGAPPDPPARARADVTFRWPVAEAWRKETIPFPLEFAKDLPFSGVEEIRFAPGMFKPGEEGFWS